MLMFKRAHSAKLVWGMSFDEANAGNGEGGSNGRVDRPKINGHSTSLLCHHQFLRWECLLSTTTEDSATLPVRTTTAGSSALGDSGTGIDDPSKLTYPSFSSALCCKPFARLTAVFQPLLSHRDQIPIPVLPVRLHFSHSVHPYSNGFRVFFFYLWFFPNPRLCRPVRLNPAKSDYTVR
ncbi:Hypothetical protein NTJ_11046 [Nesidiocoris tenuis]|uniref:Uncharacterized protein n=1 Tax=Nesidiocoris tenuis TaxID=355587 RepID=A0ABN7B1D2_9HEMI|nr:Hypothetical protein NTJ_11046 [Nesidiocoris tenuis]